MKTKFGRLVIMVLAILMFTTAFAGCSNGAQNAPTTSEEASASQSQSGASQAADEKITIGYTTKAEEDFLCKYMMDLFTEKVKAMDNVEVTTADAQYTIETQLDQIDNFISLGVDVIVLDAVDADGIAPGVLAANEANIPVIAVYSEPSSGEYTFVGATVYKSGYMQGEYMMEVLPENGKLLYLTGPAGNYYTTNRMDGFFDAFTREDYTLLDTQYTDFTKPEGMAVTDNWLQVYDDFDAIVGANDQLALGALESLKAADRLDDVIIIGIDATEDALIAIENGEMTMSIFQDIDEQAKVVLDLCVKAAKGEAIEGHEISYISVTIDNYKEYISIYQ